MGTPLRWASVDGAARTSGVALWLGGELVGTGVVRGVGVDDWRRVLRGQAGCVIEEGYVGRNRRVGLRLAWARGRIEAVAEVEGLEVWARLPPSEWRRLVGVPPGLGRKAAKRAAVAMCRWLRAAPGARPAAREDSYWAGRHLANLRGDATEDECEAVLLGLAWIRQCDETRR